MTFGIPVTLLDMRAALREECQLDSNDPRSTDAVLNRLLNAAMHRFQIANPNGWPWDYAESTLTLTPGVDAVTFPVGIGLGDPTKIRYAILRHPAGAWEYPLERTTRWDQLNRYATDGQQAPPRTFSLLGSSSTVSGVTGMVMKLRPYPDVAYTLLLGAQAPGPDLVADADPAPATNDYMISEWSPTLLQYAAYLVWRAKGDLTEALNGAKQAFDADVISMRRSGRVALGPGRTLQNPVADLEGLS